jgi:hypothetical protein
MSIASEAERLDLLCARFGPALERLWIVRDQPTVRMVTPVTDHEMSSRFDDAELLLALVGSWNATEPAADVPPELHDALVDREKRLGLERLTVLIRRRNDRLRA